MDAFGIKTGRHSSKDLFAAWLPSSYERGMAFKQEVIIINRGFIRLFMWTEYVRGL